MEGRLKITERKVSFLFGSEGWRKWERDKENGCWVGISIVLSVLQPIACPFSLETICPLLSFSSTPPQFSWIVVDTLYEFDVHGAVCCVCVILFSDLKFPLLKWWWLTCDSEGCCEATQDGPCLMLSFCFLSTVIYYKDSSSLCLSVSSSGSCWTVISVVVTPCQCLSSFLLFPDNRIFLPCLVS